MDFSPSFEQQALINAISRDTLRAYRG